jgi:hypothetical protein
VCLQASDQFEGSISKIYERMRLTFDISSLLSFFMVFLIIFNSY